MFRVDLKQNYLLRLMFVSLNIKATEAEVQAVL